MDFSLVSREIAPHQQREGTRNLRQLNSTSAHRVAIAFLELSSSVWLTEDDKMSRPHHSHRCYTLVWHSIGKKCFLSQRGEVSAGKSYKPLPKILKGEFVCTHFTSLI